MKSEHRRDLRFP